ncbi:MAG TPA: hypothetical protein GXZ76_01950 [Clostridiaceae bacterium]|nr:hypothetical protein [Clostridiaceae bacterium]
MKPKKKINVGFLITAFLLLSIIIVFIVLNSRVALAKSDLQEQVKSYQTTMTKALIAKPAEISQFNSVLASGKDIEQRAEEFAENHWIEIQAQIADYYYDQDTLNLHKRLFCDLLKNSFINGTYLNNITNMSTSDQTFQWNLKNQIKSSTLWEIESDLEIRNNNQIISDYFFYVTSEIVWQKINNQWKIIIADPIFPPEFTYYEETVYETYYGE